MRVGMRSAPSLQQQVDPRLRVAHAGLALVLVLMLAFLAAPLAAILKQALEDASGRFVGLANFIAYARTPSLLDSLANSLWVSALVTAIVIPLALRPRTTSSTCTTRVRWKATLASGPSGAGTGAQLAARNATRTIGTRRVRMATPCP